MDQEFKEWLLKDSDEWSPQQKNDILRMLKFNPEQLVKNISLAMEDWGTVYIQNTGKVLAQYNTFTDAQELVEAYKVRFADKLAAIT